MTVFARMSGVRLADALSASCETLLPCLCLHCGEPMGGDRAGLCSSCWTRVVPRAGASCTRCGAPIQWGIEGCVACTSESVPQTNTVIWGEYEGPLRSAVLEVMDKQTFPSMTDRDLLYFGDTFVFNEYESSATGHLRLIPPHWFGPPERCYWKEETDLPGLVVNAFGAGKGMRGFWTV